MYKIFESFTIPAGHAVKVAKDADAATELIAAGWVVVGITLAPYGVAFVLTGAPGPVDAAQRLANARAEVDALKKKAEQDRTRVEATLNAVRGTARVAQNIVRKTERNGYLKTIEAVKNPLVPDAPVSGD